MTAFKLTFGAEDVRLLKEEAVFSGHFSVHRVTLEHRLFAGGWSGPLVREIFERGDAVAVLPYHPPTDSLVLIEQFRPGAMRANDSPWMLELVAGVVEAGESDEQVAHRETMEETGCEVDELLPIATVLPSAGACTEQVRLFCGRVSSEVIEGLHGLQSEGEDIRVHRIPRSEALALMAANRIPNGHTLIALQWLQINQDSVRERWS